MSDTLQRGAERLMQVATKHGGQISFGDRDAVTDAIAADPGIRALVERVQYYESIFWQDAINDWQVKCRDDDRTALRKWEQGDD